MQKKLSLRAQLAQFETTKSFPLPDGDSWCHGFYDWFCADTSLERRSKSLVSKLKKFLAKNPDIDQDKTYAFFKNNCPMNGPTYDDFRICDLKKQEVIYTVVPKCTHSGQAEVWGHGPEGFGCLAKKPSFKELLAD
jgi:hypothetical protein